MDQQVLSFIQVMALATVCFPSLTRSKFNAVPRSQTVGSLCVVDKGLQYFNKSRDNGSSYSACTRSASLKLPSESPCTFLW